MIFRNKHNYLGYSIENYQNLIRFSNENDIDAGSPNAPEFEPDTFGYEKYL